LLLPAGEVRLLEKWNETARDFGVSSCVHRLFEQQAAAHPLAIALEFADERLTYEELNQRANQLARHLLELGLKSETVVGLCMERSAELVVAILAVLKAGGAYLPLDPLLPRKRMHYMIQDAGVQLALVDKGYQESLPSEVLSVELPSSQLQVQQPQENLSLEPSLDSLAYVLYTSGSTGQPKGVMSLHRGLLNRLLWMQDAFGLTPEDRVLQKTPFTFDV